MLRVGVAYYTESEYAKLLLLADYKEKLSETYAEWLAKYNDVIKKLKKEGLSPEPFLY